MRAVRNCSLQEVPFSAKTKDKGRVGSLRFSSREVSKCLEFGAPFLDFLFHVLTDKVLVADGCPKVARPCLNDLYVSPFEQLFCLFGMPRFDHQNRLFRVCIVAVLGSDRRHSAPPFTQLLKFSKPCPVVRVPSLEEEPSIRDVQRRLDDGEH